MDRLTKDVRIQVEKTDKPRTFRFRISDGTVDRDKDRIDPAGWELDNYRRNPVVLLSHDYSSLPVAKTTEIGVQGGALMATAEFPSEGIFPQADQVFRLIKEGYLSTASVGFRPIEWVYNSDRGGMDYHKQELLEWSVVPVPALSTALIESRTAKTDWAAVKKFFNGTTGGFTPPREEPMLSATENMYRAMDIAHAGVQHARKLWEAADPRNPGGTGQNLDAPDWARMDSDYVPKACRGLAGLTPREQEILWQRRYQAAGAGPSRAHRDNLVGATIDLEDAHQLTDVLRSIIRDFVRNEAAPKINRAVAAAVARARGRVD